MEYYCGIDLGATNSDLCVLDDRDNILLRKKVSNDKAQILKVLEPFKDDLEVVVESTFNWYWLIDALQEAGYKVVFAGTLGVFWISGAKVKTDPIDSLKLARLLKSNSILEAYIYPKEDRPVRALVRQRLKLVRERGKQYTSLRILLYQHGHLDHSRDGIKSMGREHLDEIFQDDQLTRLFSMQGYDRIDMLSEQIEVLEKVIFGLSMERPEFSLLQTLPGVGRVIGSTILYEIGEISRFKNAKKFCSYCRLVPGIAQSGKVSRRGRGSKQGNPNLKWAFSQAAVYAVRTDPVVKRHFQKHVRRHRGRGSKPVAYSIIARKLATAAFHILKDGVEYREELLFRNDKGRNLGLSPGLNPST